MQINRCATTVKGGRRMSFSALVVTGDKKGLVGIGFGKAKEVPNAVEKAFKDARKRMIRIAIAGTTIPHEITGRLGASKVFMMPAADGTGVIAGAAARAVLECAGVQNILTKTFGSTNAVNVAKATFGGLTRLRTKEQVEKLRGISLS
ncbi:MAG: 30S ribosomal protein S5 [Planctomycetes bacterium]|nr:30S ribosomal protein S5 [Planctomycetota bacterium]